MLSSETGGVLSSETGGVLRSGISEQLQYLDESDGCLFVRTVLLLLLPTLREKESTINYGTEGGIQNKAH